MAETGLRKTRMITHWSHAKTPGLAGRIANAARDIGRFVAACPWHCLLSPKPIMPTGGRRPCEAGVKIVRLSALLLAASLWSIGILAATGPETYVESADTLRSSVKGSATLSEDQKTQAGARLDEVVGMVRDIDEAQKTLASMRQTLDQAPARLEELSRLEAQIPGRMTAESLVGEPTRQIEARLIQQRADVAALQEQLDAHEQRLNRLQSQSRSDASDLTALQKRLSELEQTEAEPSAQDPVAAVDALWRSARAALTRARIAIIRLRQGNIELFVELARRERDVAAEQLDAAAQNQSQLLDVVQARRQQEAEAVISTAQQGTAMSAGLRAIQANSAALAHEQARLLAKETELQRRLEQVNRTSERLNRDYDRIQQIVELGGSSSQVSALLQKRRNITPSSERLGRETLKLQQELSDAGLRQLELDEQLQELVDLDSTVAYLKATYDLGADADQLQGLRELATFYRQAVLELWQGYTRYLTVLSQLEANTRSLTLEARRYQGFINDRLLWVPSTELVPLSKPGLLIDGLKWFVDQQNLKALVKDVLRIPRTLTGPALLWVLGILVFWFLRRRALSALARRAEQTQKIRTDRFGATVVALLSTLVLAIWVPWILAGAGVLLGRLPNSANSSLLYAAGLQAAGQVVLFLGTFRHLCRTNGLAPVHLQWHPRLCDALRRQAVWLMPIALPLGFFVSAGSATVPSEFIQLATAVRVENAGVVSLGRFAFTLQMLALGVAIYRIWRRQGSVMTAFADSPNHSNWANYHILWFGPSLLIPVLLATFALLGYFYTSVFLMSVAAETLWFIVFVIIGKDLLFRSLYVTQRRLRFQEALRRRDELIAKRTADIEGVEPPEEKAVEAIEQEKIDYRELGDQVRSLVQFGFTITLLAGLWWIWRDIFPAFSFLDGIELPITTSKLIDGVTKDVPLTLGDMVTGLLLGGLALFAAMKVPAVLELTLLQRLPMSRASRYAVTTLLQYIVAVIGLVTTFNALGLEWSSIQWLVAALSVGLGFGLQEIVANFVSGVILLFEQPIRVGDIVTVDGTTGTVSKIRIRATTIVNYDRQELVIPNKNFITGQLVNWTLTDTINRALITVGVSYATDTREARELIRQAADEHPNVLKDPAPVITFEAFGDNALTLNLRAYLGDLEKRLLTITELHQSILDKFREADIEIAFPQRDVHLMTAEPLELKLTR